MTASRRCSAWWSASMIKEYIRYGSVTTKARAMFSRMLTESDWDALKSAENLRQVWELLKASGAWRQAEDIRCAEDGGTLKNALRGQLELDVKHLCLYLKAADQETLRFYLRRPEGLTPEEAKRWWSDGRAGKAGLRRIAGAEADALNIVYILRLRAFPASAAGADELLLDVRDKLTPELTRKLLRAPDDRTALQILEKTPWGSVFTSLAPGELEKQYVVYMEAFCRRVLAGGRPGLTAVQAFVTLKDLERQRLNRLIAAVEQGIDPALVV